MKTLSVITQKRNRKREREREREREKGKKNGTFETSLFRKK